jgi:hypothetical protein
MLSAAVHAEAGGLPDPSLLRTWAGLKKTLVHLRQLMGRVGPEAAASNSSGGVSLLEAHRFLWDRYRSIRKDITQTSLAHKVRQTWHNTVCRRCISMPVQAGLQQAACKCETPHLRSFAAAVLTVAINPLLRACRALASCRG